MTGSSTVSNEPLWVEEIEPGRLAMVYRRQSGGIDETIYREEPRKAADFSKLRAKLSTDLETLETEWLEAHEQ